jgi:hypothetical protein
MKARLYAGKYSTREDPVLWPRPRSGAFGVYSAKTVSSIVLPPHDQNVVVRHELLSAERKVRQGPPRLEGLVERPLAGGDAREEVGETVQRRCVEFYRFD